MTDGSALAPNASRFEPRGRTLVLCRAEVCTASGKLAADGTLTCTIRPPR